jgi:chromosomal replication initiator protein
MDALEERLRERFESGLLADIESPDFTTRLAIVRKRARDQGVPFVDGEVLDLLAARITDNIRALEGALTGVVAFASLAGEAITVELARSVLDRLHPVRAPGRHHSVREIQLATCRAFAVSLDDLLSHDRSVRIVWPRQVAMHLARELTDLTLPAIGRDFGGRDHTTVIHADRRARQRLTGDAHAQMMLERVHKELSDPQT